jgi:hypothetical protein
VEDGHNRMDSNRGAHGRAGSDGADVRARGRGGAHRNAEGAAGGKKEDAR